MQTIYADIVLLILSEPQFVNFLLNVRDENDFIYVTFKKRYEEYIRLLETLMDLQNNNDMSNMHLFDNNWFTYNLPDKLVPFIIIASVSYFQDLFKIKLNE